MHISNIKKNTDVVKLRVYFDGTKEYKKKRKNTKYKWIKKTNAIVKDPSCK